MINNKGTNGRTKWLLEFGKAALGVVAGLTAIWSGGVIAGILAAGEAEETAAGPGNWFSRFTGCENTYYRLVRSVSRVQDLTIGSGRPDFIPGGAGSEAWRQLSERIDEARRRARAACSSIEPPR